MEALERMFAQLRENPTLELEARIGTREQSFSPVVSQDAFEIVQDKLTTSPALDSSRCEESHVYYYADPVPTRSETFFDSHSLNVRVVTTVKQCLEKVDVDVGRYTVRFALSRERNVPPSGKMVLPSAVRVRQRTSHVHKGRRMLVRYDLTRFIDGPSRAAVESKRDANFAIELEVVKRWGTDAECAASLYAKCADICRLIPPQ